MKSRLDQLLSRGYLQKDAVSGYLNKSIEEKIQLLNSSIPAERTLGARLLAVPGNSISVNFLISVLTVENKLYTKIEICDALVVVGSESIKPLIDMLGRIGNNQHKTIPENNFKKENYPLPHDITARTLIRFGKKALPELIKVLDSGNIGQLSEAIDAIGYICFYDYSSEIYKILEKCYIAYTGNNLIKWKIIRAMSGMPESTLFLKEQKNILKNNRLLNEISRSMYLIRKRN